MISTLPLFALFSLAPAPLLALAALGGGVWLWLALAYVTLLSTLADLTMRRVSPAMDPDAPAWPANLISVVLALCHFPLLAGVVHALSGATGLAPGARAALFMAAGYYFGQVGNANAHELIHRANRFLHGLGKWVYISLLFGHHTSAHLKVHHVRVATPEDPVWPRPGEGFYRFAPRAWLGGFTAGWAAENALRRHARGHTGPHPYVLYTGGAALCLALAGIVDGPGGFFAYLLLAAFTHAQLLLSDYVQHYGLVRERRGQGYEPVSAAHSWNSRHWFTSLMLLNAPRHSDHHAHPARPYPALRLPGEGEAPRMPHALPVMAAIGLIPPLWRRMMKRELARWEAIRQGRSQET